MVFLRRPQCKNEETMLGCQKMNSSSNRGLDEEFIGNIFPIVTEKTEKLKKSVTIGKMFPMISWGNRGLPQENMFGQPNIGIFGPHREQRNKSIESQARFPWFFAFLFSSSNPGLDEEFKKNGGTISVPPLSGGARVVPTGPFEHWPNTSH